MCLPLFPSASYGQWRNSDGATDNDGNGDGARGDDDVDDVRPRPPHTTINLYDEEKGGLSDEEKGGGEATVDANIRGRDGDAADKEKIRTAATEKEGAKATRRTAVSHGGAGLKMTTIEATVEAMAVASRGDTGASTTATTATMVTATTMTGLNVCDVSMEEKEHPSNRMHATIK